MPAGFWAGRRLLIFAAQKPVQKVGGFAPHLFGMVFWAAGVVREIIQKHLPTNLKCYLRLSSNHAKKQNPPTLGVWGKPSLNSQPQL